MVRCRGYQRAYRASNGTPMVAGDWAVICAVHTDVSRRFWTLMRSSSLGHSGHHSGLAEKARLGNNDLSMVYLYHTQWSRLLQLCGNTERLTLLRQTYDLAKSCWRSRSQQASGLSLSETIVRRLMTNNTTWKLDTSKPRTASLRMEHASWPFHLPSTAR